MLQRFSHILVPLDFTAKNLSALDVAFEIASQNRSNVTLLHVVQELADSEDDDEINTFYSKLERRANEELAGSAERFQNAGLSVDCKTTLGDRAAEIVVYAKEHDCDLIVMSSHVVDPQTAASNLWTVSYQVSVLCRCPILLMKNETDIA